MRDSPIRLLEDLDRCSFVMGSRVGWIGVLVRIEIGIRICRDQLAHLDDRAVGPFTRVAVHDLGAVCGDQRLALSTHVAGHDELHPITLRRADQRVGDAGVA